MSLIVQPSEIYEQFSSKIPARWVTVQFTTDIRRVNELTCELHVIWEKKKMAVCFF